MNAEEKPETLRRRIFAIDLLRGIVMMIMLLDHTRDFIHAGGLSSDPANPATPSVLLFFTRWITHYCAPVFVFLSGVSIYLQRLSGKSNAELSRFLWTRGLGLIFLEFTVIRFLVFFNLDYSMVGMPQVIWAIGVSMIVMAALIYAPIKAVGWVGVATIVLHNLLDPIRVPPQTAFGGTPPADLWQSVWMILHQQGLIELGGAKALVLYPLVPWVGVMMAGYALGTVYSWDGERRRKVLLKLGLAATALFILLRFVNVYGDPSPRITQAPPAAATQGANTPADAAAAAPRTGGPVFAFLSFLNTTKYPPSLLFLLMTLGPALIALALADNIDGNAAWQRICITFGRVPLFFYMLQWAWAHGAAVALSYLAGKEIHYLFLDPFAMAQVAPAGHGFSLAVVYAVWIGGLIIIYPLCAWYARVKKESRSPLLSYL